MRSSWSALKVLDAIFRRILNVQVSQEASKRFQSYDPSGREFDKKKHESAP